MTQFSDANFTAFLGNSCVRLIGAVGPASVYLAIDGNVIAAGVEDGPPPSDPILGSG